MSVSLHGKEDGAALPKLQVNVFLFRYRTHVRADLSKSTLVIEDQDMD